MFSDQFLDELRSRTALVGLVGRRVRLIKRGREHTGLCPFHNEKTPSFTVSEEKAFYHCFGCGAHGGAIDFVMATEGLGFREAVERLAADAGMALPVEDAHESERTRVRQSLYDLLESAARFFEARLHLAEGAHARDYLAGRGLAPEAQARHRLGLSPRAGGLREHLRAQGASDDDLLACGLTRRPDDGRDPYDYFRGRLMFPIRDRRGRVIAFGARTLDGSEPKYLNSPETELFSKGATLYGIERAGPPARDTGRVIVVEGYMDAIAMAEAGFPETVAPLGTALTETQLKLLWKMAAEPVLAFDGDAAGARAGARALERALPELVAGVGLKLAFLPAGEDPDSLIQKRGAHALESVLAGAIPLSEALWRLEAGARPPATPEGRAALESRLKLRIARINDSAVRQHFMNDVRERMRTLGRTPRQPWGRQGARPGAYGGARTGRWAGAGAAGRWVANAPAGLDAAGSGASGGRAQLSEAERAQLHEAILLATLINHPALLDDMAERLGALQFSDAGLDQLRQAAAETGHRPHEAAGESLDSATFQGHLLAQGLGDALKRVLSPRTYEHAFFARPEASIDEARAGWQETLALYRKFALDADLDVVRRRLAAEGGSSAFDALRALKAEQHAQAESTGTDDVVGGAQAWPAKGSGL